jgi:hypothetical protein
MPKRTGPICEVKGRSDFNWSLGLFYTLCVGLSGPVCFASAHGFLCHIPFTDSTCCLKGPFAADTLSILLP